MRARLRANRQVYLPYQLGFVLFVCSLGILYAGFVGTPQSTDEADRRLTEGKSNSNGATTSRGADDPSTFVEWCLTCDNGGFILYVLGILYMFIALAIVCDEYFVPSLEVITEKLGWSDDMAGATFMAAGGSAPELATSTIGTFSQPPSAVGFGTIVGSAVFNVLFVIGMCAVFSKEVLSLTWWPLARDASYYTLSLIVLAVLFRGGPKGENVIEVWESLILLGLYFGYVFLMSNNEVLHRWVVARTEGDAKVVPKGNESGQTPADGQDALRRISACSPDYEKLNSNKKISPFLAPTTFRAGVLQLLITEASMMDRVSSLMVGAIAGDVDFTFDQIDENGNGTIDESELVQLFIGLGLNPTKEEVRAAAEEIDTSHDGIITKDEFKAWYNKSEMKIEADMRKVFEKIDEERTNCIERHNLKNLMAQFDHDISDADVKAMWEEAIAYERSDDKSKLSFEAFAKWYQSTVLWKKRAEEGGDNNDDSGLSLEWPQGTKQQALFILLLPLAASLHYTIPDVRVETKKHLFIVSFFLSILWIGAFSFLMVEWATVLCLASGIPIEVMGLTILAAGTSIPDLLTSVIVARQGLGDMAVSSSIGSNIFDVLVGLPLPWFLRSITDGFNPVAVKADTLFFSIIVLLGMLLIVILTIKAYGWRMTKGLGYSMFVLYVVFVVQDLLRQYKVFSVSF